MFCVFAVTTEMLPQQYDVVLPEIGCQNDARPDVNVEADADAPPHVLMTSGFEPSIVAYIE